MSTYTNEQIARMKDYQGMSYREIMAATGLKYNQVQWAVKTGRSTPPPRLPASPYPRFDSPLEITGDVLVLNDLEVPFHHADFVNRCLDLAQAWGIKQLILGGDWLHFETFSAWGAAWQEEKPQVDTLSEKREAQLRALADTLPDEARAALLAQVDEMAQNSNNAGDEIKAGARALKILPQVFGDIYCVIGNHDDRFLRMLKAPMTPQKLLDFMGLNNPAFRIRPYYFAELISGGEKWRIEHQRGAGLNVAIKMADKYDCHAICAHNHLQALNWSYNGRHYAISSGHACDELRMAYAAQRSNNAPVHNMGAVIVREGTPWLLNNRTDWAVLARL